MGRHPAQQLRYDRCERIYDLDYTPRNDAFTIERGYYQAEGSVVTYQWHAVRRPNSNFSTNSRSRDLALLARDIRTTIRLEGEKARVGHERLTREEIFRSFCVRRNDAEVYRLGEQMLEVLRGNSSAQASAGAPISTKLLTVILEDFRAWYEENDIPFPAISVRIDRETESPERHRSRLIKRLEKMEGFAKGFIKYCVETHKTDPSNHELSIYTDMNEVAVSRLSKEPLCWAVTLRLLNQRLAREKTVASQKALWEDARTKVRARIPAISSSRHSWGGDTISVRKLIPNLTDSELLSEEIQTIFEELSAVE